MLDTTTMLGSVLRQCRVAQRTIPQLQASRRYSNLYDGTIPNLRVNKDTRVIFQGLYMLSYDSRLPANIKVRLHRKSCRRTDVLLPVQLLTCFQATLNAKDTIAYGTNIVGGVSPGKGGQTHLDLPVFDSVTEVGQRSESNCEAKVDQNLYLA